MTDMFPEIDEELTNAFVDEIERAFHTICEEHPDEQYYLACVVYNEQMLARFMAFSEEGLNRACEEQEITSDREKGWYRIGGYDILCDAYDYSVPLTECNKILTQRNLALPDKSVMGDEQAIRINSATEALQRLSKDGLFGENCMCMSKIAPNRQDPLPPNWF